MTPVADESPGPVLPQVLGTLSNSQSPLVPRTLLGSESVNL